MKNNIKKYSAIILTHAPKDGLIVSLEMLMSQSIVPERIVIYNTDKDMFYSNIINKDKLNNVLTMHKDVIQIVNIDSSEFDHGRSRNEAIKFINTDYVLYLTDDAVAYNDSMCENLLEAFNTYSDSDGKVAASYARQVAKPDARLSEKYVREFNYPEHDIVKTKKKEKELGIKNYFFSNVCAMYDRNIFYNVGCFEEDIILNEDTFFAYAAINKGYKIVYVSKAIVYHSHNYSFRQQFSRNFDIGVSQSEKKDIFDSIPTSKEGMKFASWISCKLCKGLHFIVLFQFIIECAYRYFGFKRGYNYNKLSIDNCIKYATNKNYFLKKKHG